MAGKTRTISNVPGGMWLQDIRNGMPLILTDQKRIGLRGLAPGGKEEKELGWLGWSIPGDISRDGKKVLFEEEADGGGPNYTVFLRDTDGSPPVRIGEGNALAISPDSKMGHHAARQRRPAEVGSDRSRRSSTIDTGQHRLCHRALSARRQTLLAAGIESGHAARDYIIDLSTGDAKPLTPEGIDGVSLSPDGRSTSVIGPEGKWGIWPIEGGGFHPIPDLDPKYAVAGWSPDGTSLYVSVNRMAERTAKLSRVNITTGKMEPWREFGQTTAPGSSAGPPHFSVDGSAYEYVYVQTLSQAFAVRGLK